MRHLTVLGFVVVALVVTTCGGEGESEFKQSRVIPKRLQGSGEGVNVSAAAMTIVDGIKQWDGPPLGLTGGLLIHYMDEYRATVHMETVGGQPASDRTIVIDFWFSDFPRYQSGNVNRTVNNFVFLAREGFYDGYTFTVEPGRLIRTGDPPGPLTGAGYEFDNELTTEIIHDRPGIVSTWNEGERPGGRGTNSSQWFIALAALPEFDYYDEEIRKKDCTQPEISCHTPFGFIIEGMDIVGELVDGDRIKTISIEKLPRGTSTTVQRKKLIAVSPAVTPGAASTAPASASPTPE